jgi:hypothetical protein
LQEFHRRLFLLLDYYRQLCDVAGNPLAIADEMPESNSIQCARVGENEADMSFEALCLALDVDSLHCLFIESIE